MFEKKIKWDGHCHSELCPHGKGEETAHMVEKAIAEGFTRLSLTEHAPLPVGLIQPQSLHNELALTEQQMPEYLELVQGLKATYKNQIEILTGLEVDYIAGQEAFTKDFLDQWGPELDDSLLSLHIIQAGDAYQMVDYSPEDWKANLIPHFGSAKAVQASYWEHFQLMLESNLGAFKPTRIGHAGLIYKFHKAFAGDFEVEMDADLVENLVATLSQKGFSLDYNVNGLNLKTCGQPLMPQALLDRAKKAKIPLVYGSDAHGIKAIGQYYSNFENITHD
ncbi:MAG: histidinol-phosphatase HisJ [SAR324 cluster bacterium]|nr:histidinol-phosphatase HisJ [SAR324 cluster bacterium]